MDTRMNRRLFTALLLIIVIGGVVAPALAQNAPPGAAAPSGDNALAKTNEFVIGAVLLALAAIVIAVVFRKKPAELP